MTSHGWHYWDTRIDRVLGGTAAGHSYPQSTCSRPHIASMDMSSRCEYSHITNAGMAALFTGLIPTIK